MEDEKQIEVLKTLYTQMKQRKIEGLKALYTDTNVDLDWGPNVTKTKEEQKREKVAFKETQMKNRQQQALADSVNNPKFGFLQSKEGADNDYNTPNRAGSSAYGKYQFMPDTAKMYASRIGIDPNTWTEPANQELIMEEADKDYTQYLSKWGQEVNDANKYAVHQLGPGRAERLFNNKLTNSDISIMNDNLPKGKKATDRMTIVSNWKNTYLQ